MEKIKRALLILLALTMLLSVTACSKTSEQPTAEQPAAEEAPAKAEEKTETKAEEKTEEPLEILKTTLYGNSTSLESGTREGYMKDLFAKYGLEVEVWAFSEDKTNAMLASGDLPDVMYVTIDQLNAMLESDMVLNLDDYLDKLPNVTNYEDYAGALAYSRAYLSGGTGNLYALPTYVGKNPSTGTTDRSQLMLNWDYYSELGCPEFNNLDELIEIFKQMKENHPTDAMGNPTYAAVTYYTPGAYDFCIGYGSYFGYISAYFDKLGAANMRTGELEYLLEEDGLLYNTTKYLNKLYREDLLDPESISIDRSSLLTRTWDNPETGTYFSVLAEVSGSNDYFKPIYFPGEYVWSAGGKDFGQPGLLVVNANTKNIEGALRLLNMFADPAAYLEWLSMPEGEAWYVKEGTNEAYLTDEFIDFLTNGGGAEFVMSTGEKRVLFNTLPIVTQGTDCGYVDADGNPRSTLIWNWKEALLITDNLPRQAAWRDQYGYDTWFDLLNDKGALIQTSDIYEADKFAQSPSDDQKLQFAAVNDSVVTWAWKMIYAESEEEFEGYWASLQADADGLGARELYEWEKANIDEAIKTKLSFIGE